MPKIQVSGNVQGVNFRAKTKEYADKLHINGTVKNLSDGSVEITTDASDEKLYFLLKELSKNPGGVTHYSFEESNESFSDFRIL